MLRIDEIDDETESVVDETANDETETIVDETAEEDEIELGNKKTKKKLSKKKKVIITVVVLVIAIIAAGLITIVIKNDTSFKKFDETIVTTDGVESNCAEFIQLFTYYKSMYSQYGQSVEDDQLKEDVLKQLEFIDTCYKRAQDTNMERSEEDEEELNNLLDQLKQAAEEQSCTEDEVIAAQYGKGFSKEIYTELVKKQQLANHYQQKLVDDIKAKYADGKADAEIEKTYEADRKAYDLSNAQYCYFDAEDENAKSEAQSVISAVKGGATFESAVETSNNAKMGNGMVGYDYDTVSQNFGSDVAEYLFKLENKKYTSVKGSITSVTANGTLYVIYVNDAPARDDLKPVTAQYGLVSIGTSDVKTQDELVAAAKKKAKDAYNEYMKLDAKEKTSENFVAAMQKDEDIGVDTFNNVGYYDKLDAKIRDWLFDNARKQGDVTTIETEDGIYVVYYDQKAENPSWYTTILNDKMSTDQSNLTDEIEASVKDKITVNEDLVTECIAYSNRLLGISE